LETVAQKIENLIDPAKIKVFRKCFTLTLKKTLFSVFFTMLPIFIVIVVAVSKFLGPIINGTYINGGIIKTIIEKVSFSSLLPYAYAFLVPPLVSILTKNTDDRIFLNSTFLTCIIMSIIMSSIEDNLPLNKISIILFIIFSFVPFLLLFISIFKEEEGSITISEDSEKKSIEKIMYNSENIKRG